MIDVLTVRGTGERRGSAMNMLSNLTRLLDPTQHRIVDDVDYPASVGPANPGVDPLGCSEAESVQAGVAAIAAAVRACPNRVGLLGYSLGAETVARFLEAQAAGQYGDCELAWVGLVANPVRAPGDSIDPDPVGYGINGAHAPYPAGLPVWEAANPRDAITSSPADSPLRQLADGVSALTFADTSWTVDLADRIARNRWQPANPAWWLHPISTGRAWTAAAAGIYGYLDGSAHIRDYIAGGFLDRLATRINTPAT